MKNMFNVTTGLPHSLLQTTFRHKSSESTRYNFTMWALSCTTFPGLQRRSHWTCSSLGTIFQPMRINSVPGVRCFCSNKNVLCAQSMVRHFMRHPVCSAKHWCPPWDVNRCSVKKNRETKKILDFLKFEFSIFDHSLIYCSYKNLYNNLSFGTNRSLCADFYLINGGPQNIFVP